MFDLTAMIIADKATREHVRSAQPAARTTPDRHARQSSNATRRLTVAALRRLADRLEPHRVSAPVRAS